MIEKRPLSRSSSALACFFFRFPGVQFIVRPGKPGTIEICQECLLCYDRQITAKIRTFEQATETQTKAPFRRPKIFGTARMKKVRVPKKLVRHG